MSANNLNYEPIPFPTCQETHDALANVASNLIGIASQREPITIPPSFPGTVEFDHHRGEENLGPSIKSDTEYLWTPAPFLFADKNHHLALGVTTGKPDWDRPTKTIHNAESTLPKVKTFLKLDSQVFSVELANPHLPPAPDFAECVKHMPQEPSSIIFRADKQIVEVDGSADPNDLRHHERITIARTMNGVRKGILLLGHLSLGNPEWEEAATNLFKTAANAQKPIPNPPGRIGRMFHPDKPMR